MTEASFFIIKLVLKNLYTRQIQSGRSKKKKLFDFVAINLSLQIKHFFHFFVIFIKKKHAYIVAVNFHQRWVFFADFSVNSESIFMKFYKHSFQLLRRLP